MRPLVVAQLSKEVINICTLGHRHAFMLRAKEATLAAAGAAAVVAQGAPDRRERAVWQPIIGATVRQSQPLFYPSGPVEMICQPLEVSCSL